MASCSPKLEDVSPKHVEFEASIFSALEATLPPPLSLNLPPRFDIKHVNETRRSRHDSRTSHRSSLHQSSSPVFRTLPPIRRMPSLQVPSLTDITNPHALSQPRRSLHQISETEPSTFKLKLPPRLVHPNSPYVPWDPPVRQKILCPAPASNEQEAGVDDIASDRKPIKQIWSTFKTKCQRLLNPRTKNLSIPVPPLLTRVGAEPDSLDSKDQAPAHTLDTTPCSPTSSLRSADTHTLAVWLADRHRKVLDKDCESAKIMTIEDYERVGSWIKQRELQAFNSSRSSYHCSIAEGDTVSISSVFILESDHELLSSPPEQSSSPFLRSPVSNSSRLTYGPKRIGEEERLSRIVHRQSLRSYLVERSLSIPTSVSIS